jgi:UV DNA damage endonuclease
MIRFGLCCIFHDHPVKFRHINAANAAKLPEPERLHKLSSICLDNSFKLEEALLTVDSLGIGAFRILSQILPLYTHPQSGYKLEALTDAAVIFKNFARIREFREAHDIRLSFHPDQFITLSSPNKQVFENSLRELEYQCMVADLTGAENVNIHLGGTYGNKTGAIKRFAGRFPELPESVRRHLTLENDDISYTVEDLYPLCLKLNIPLVYDVHHHRCNPDSLSAPQATELCAGLWRKLGREPHFHISSPKNGWQSKNPRPHADYIDINDFPECWSGMSFTLDVEAKTKESAIIRLREDLRRKFKIEM